MERQEFLKSLGLGFFAVCAGSCLSACGGKDETGTPAPSPGPGTPPIAVGNKVTVNMSTMPNVGDSTKLNGVLFFRMTAGTTAASFVATEAICPHQGGNLDWIQNQSLIQCNLHQAQFTSSGAVTRGPQNSSGSVRALKIYALVVENNTSLTATVS
jgi:Rieske Fe-S protein